MTTDDRADWPEVESPVHRPQYWVVVAVIAFFLVLGMSAFIGFGPVRIALPWWMWTIIGICLGLATCAAIIGEFVTPARIRHASPDVLPNVPTDPVIVEGAAVHGRVTHELVEDAEGWQFRPAPRQRRNDRQFMLGFGIPFLIAFAALLSWIFHREMKIGGWLFSIFCAMSATALCGGSAFLIGWMVMNSGYRRLCHLRIGKDGGDLELDAPEPPTAEQADDLVAGMRWIFLGDTNRHQLRIPRETVAAVQLCPWKVVIGRSGNRTIANAVQGLLVLADQANSKYFRLPVLLTSDYAGAARLMQQLAAVLRVPFLYCADDDGWKAELLRAKSRQPLRIGGTSS